MKKILCFLLLMTFWPEHSIGGLEGDDGNGDSGFEYDDVTPSTATDAGWFNNNGKAEMCYADYWCPAGEEDMYKCPPDYTSDMGADNWDDCYPKEQNCEEKEAIPCKKALFCVWDDDNGCRKVDDPCIKGQQMMQGGCYTIKAYKAGSDVPTDVDMNVLCEKGFYCSGNIRYQCGTNENGVLVDPYQTSAPGSNSEDDCVADCQIMERDLCEDYYGCYWDGSNCNECPEGFFCNGLNEGTPQRCPLGSTSLAGSRRKDQCFYGNTTWLENANNEDDVNKTISIRIDTTKNLYYNKGPNESIKVQEPAKIKYDKSIFDRPVDQV